MRIPEFKLERYFAAHEFGARYVLSASDCESLSLEDLMGMADPEASDLWRDLRLGYTESQGHPLLRAEAAGLYESIEPGQILIGAPEELIFVAMSVLLAPDAHAVVTCPGYQSLHEVARALGGKVTPWRLRLEREGWRLDPAALERSISADTRVLVINFPHNPTGYLPSRAELDAIVATARRHGLVVFSDEMYRFLEYDPACRLPSIADLYERGIALSGLSKAFALPGLRIGWLATRDRAFLEAAVAFKDYTTICSSAPSEILGIVALRGREAIVARNLAIIEENLARADTFFAVHASRFRWLPPRAGSVAFPQLLGSRPVADFCREVLERESLMILPGDVFDVPGNHFRVGLGRRNFAEALGVLDAYLAKSPR